MEVRGADDEDVYMRALGESLKGDTRLWFDHLALRSITGYDMFTDLLKKERGENIDKPSEPHSSNDCDVEDHFDENDQDNDNDQDNGERLVHTGTYIYGLTDGLD